MIKNICPRCTEVTLSFDSEDQVTCPKCTKVFSADSGNQSGQRGE